MAQTRNEHLNWCRARARHEYDFHFPEQGAAMAANHAASMLSDLRKHPETQSSVMVCGLLMVTQQGRDSRAEVKNFLDGFL